MKNNFLKKYGFYLILSAVTLSHLVFVLCFSGVRSLWYDDIYQLFFTWNRSFIDSMNVVMRVDLNPPLWAVITHLWLKIAPYGTFWLKFPSVILVSATVFVVGLAGKELSSKKAGIIAAIFMALSPFATLECAYTFRAYGLYIFAAAFLAYAYVKKLKEQSIKNRIIFAVAIFLIAFTHYFGAFMCVFLGFFDLILAIFKKQKANFFIEYVSVASLELLWFVPQLTTISSALKAFWPPKPQLKYFFDLFKTLMFDSVTLAFIYPVAIAFFITFIIIKHKSIKKILASLLSYKGFCELVFMSVPVLMVFTIFVYSNLKPESSVWVYRYFASMVPMIFLFTASALITFYDFFKEKLKLVSIISTIVAVIILVGAFVPNYVINVTGEMKKEYEPFEQAAEIIMSQPEIKEGEKVLIINTTNCSGGWVYYLSQNNTVDLNNIRLLDLEEYQRNGATVSSYILDEFLEYDTIFLYIEHVDTTFVPSKIREGIAQTHVEEIIDGSRRIYKYVRKTV